MLTLVRTLGGIGLIAALSLLQACAMFSGATSSRSMVFVVADSRDEAKCRGGTLAVISVLDETGLTAHQDFESPPTRFSLPPGVYRLYFMHSTLERQLLDESGPECTEFTAAHPTSFGFRVNGRDNYTVSIESDGLAVLPIRVGSPEWRR